MANGHSCKAVKRRGGTGKKPLPADPDPVPFVIDKRAHFSLEFHRKEIGNIRTASGRKRGDRRGICMRNGDAPGRGPADGSTPPCCLRSGGRKRSGLLSYTREKVIGKINIGVFILNCYVRQWSSKICGEENLPEDLWQTTNTLIPS
jgi:hypothetical protein